MSTTPAAALARLRVTYPGWSIRAVERGHGYTAHRREGRPGEVRRLYAGTPGELEAALADLGLRRASNGRSVHRG